MSTEQLKRTPLHALHASLGAKLVPFGGYDMPVQYRDGIVAEHRAVRERVGVFDISHMGEFEVTGPDRNAFVQRVTCNDIGALKPGQAQYTALLTEQGTFVDDCVVYRFSDRLMLVVNAANISGDWEHIVARKLGANIRLRDVSEETGLLAVQGPGAEALLAPLTPAGIGLLPYYHFTEGKVAGMECFISRTGYTGEDGFELYCRAADLEKLWYALVGPGRAEPCGLGARDTLRLEAGYPLYGSDIDDAVTPFEAGLGWIVKLEKGADFVGLGALKQQKLTGVKRRLVGFKVLDARVVARPGYDVYVDDQKFGAVRSGTVTPTANYALGMTYLPIEQAKAGSQFTIDVRGKRAAAEVVTLPFVPRRTHKAVAAG